MLIPSVQALIIEAAGEADCQKWVSVGSERKREKDFRWAVLWQKNERKENETIAARPKRD